MIRYYKEIYDQCCKNLKKNIEENNEKNPLLKVLKTLNNFENSINPRPKHLKIIFWSFIIFASLLFLLMIFYTSSDFFHSNFPEQLFWISFAIVFILMTGLAILLCLLDNNWQPKTLKGKLTNHVLYCRGLHNEIEKYNITKLGHYKNFLTEICKKKTEWIKTKEKITSFMYKDLIGGFISIILLFIESSFASNFNNKILSSLLAYLLIIFILILPILLIITGYILFFYSSKISYYENIERNIQTIIDDMKGYYNGIQNDDHTTK